MIFKTTMAKVMAAVLAVAVVGGSMTAAGCNKQNNGNDSQTVYDKNGKDESGDNGSEDSEGSSSNLSEESRMSEIPESSAEDSGGNSSNLSEESKMPDIPESPASDFKYTIENDAVIIKKYIGSDTEVGIPEKIEGKPVTEIASFTFSDCKRLTSVDIPNSVTKIGSYAFYYCEKLTRVDIPNSVTEIGEFAFSHCESLKSITIPASVTDINKLTFQWCYRLTTIYGKAGSAAETFANEYGYTFVTN